MRLTLYSVHRGWISWIRYISDDLRADLNDLYIAFGQGKIESALNSFDDKAGIRRGKPTARLERVGHLRNLAGSSAAICAAIAVGSEIAYA
jgi:hypothetical protein